MLVSEGPERVRELMEICPRFDKVDGQIVLGREGAHSVARVVHAGGDATGSEVSSALGRGGARGQPGAALRERVRHRPAHRGGSLRRRAHAQPRRRRAHAQRGHGHRSSPPGGAGQVYGRTTNPLGRDRRRHRHGVPRRRRHPRPGVRAVPPHGARGARPGDRAADHRGAARRRRVPAQRGRRALHDRSTTRAPSWPRATSSCARMVAEMRREGTDHVYLDATHLDAAWLQERFPRVTRRSGRARPRPGHAAHPGGAGVPLLHRRRRHRRVGPHHGARPLRQRRGGQHGRARRQPAGQQLAARRARLQRPRGPRPRPLHRAASARTCAACASTCPRRRRTPTAATPPPPAAA